MSDCYLLFFLFFFTYFIKLGMSNSIKMNECNSWYAFRVKLTPVEMLSWDPGYYLNNF